MIPPLVHVKSCFAFAFRYRQRAIHVLLFCLPSLVARWFVQSPFLDTVALVLMHFHEIRLPGVLLLP